MIDLNDPQLDEHGKNVPLLTDQTIKDKIEKDCIQVDGNSSLKDAKYIITLHLIFDIAKLYNNNEPIE